MQFNMGRGSEGYMTYQPGSDKVDGYGYVKVKPTAIIDHGKKQGPYLLHELSDPYHRYHRPHHYNWRMRSYGHEPPFYPY